MKKEVELREKVARAMTFWSWAWILKGEWMKKILWRLSGRIELIEGLEVYSMGE